jgi:hypothetical protein
LQIKTIPSAQTFSFHQTPALSLRNHHTKMKLRDFYLSVKKESQRRGNCDPVVPGSDRKKDYRNTTRKNIFY